MSSNSANPRHGNSSQTRRRIYLMRHGSVSYFGPDGSRMRPEDISLTAAGREQSTAAGKALSGVRFDRVITSGLTRTLQTAQLVVDELVQRPRPSVEQWPDLRELESGRIADIPKQEIESTFLGAFKGVRPETSRFLGGESIGSLFDRVLPALDRLINDPAWDIVLLVLHGGVNRAIMSYALTGGRTFLGGLEQVAACINILDVDDERWIVRAVGVKPNDLVHAETRSTTLELLLQQYLKTGDQGLGD